MYSFKDLFKKIREEAELTQEQFARALDVSTVLVSMIETGQKEASKNIVIKLAHILDVRPSSIMPFVLVDDANKKKPQGVERLLIVAGEKLQQHLVSVKAKKLRRYLK